MARIAVFLILIGLFGACCSDKKDAAESISLTRYDRDLTAFIQTNDTNTEKNFLDRYSIFHPLYVSEILHLSPNDSSEKDALIQRLSQADMQILYRAADSLFLDTSEIEKELSEAFSRYKKLMPDDTLPTQLYCHISGLQQQIVNIDTINRSLFGKRFRAVSFHIQSLPTATQRKSLYRPRCPEGHTLYQTPNP